MKRKEYQKILVWLVLAAAISFTACSNEDNVIEEIPTQFPPQTATTIDLSKYSGIYEAKDGDILTCSDSSFNGYVIIPDSATVTLSGVNIEAPKKCDHAAIHCLGSANIIVSGTDENIVEAGSISIYPAIYVPSGSTLTISGTGTLNADGKYGTGAGIGGVDWGDGGNIVLSGATINANGGHHAAGIGSGWEGSCGNITITGGNVTATGGTESAGIGSGFHAYCGDISITGGNITATGDKFAAGIGSGHGAYCGDISITGGTGTAMGGEDSPYDIGAGKGGRCGTVSVAEGTISGPIIEQAHTCTLSFSTRFTMWPEGIQPPEDISIPSVSTITVTSPRTSQSVTVNPSSGNYFTNGTTGSFTFNVANGDVLTFTAKNVNYEWEYMNESGTFVGTYTVSGASEGATINIGMVKLMKQ